MSADGPKIRIAGGHAEIPGAILELPREAVSWRGRCAWVALWWARWIHGGKNPGAVKLSAYAGMDVSTFRSGCEELTRAGRLLVTSRGAGRSPDYELLDEVGVAYFPKPDPKKKSISTSGHEIIFNQRVRQFTDWHKVVYPDDHNGTEYPFEGAKDRDAAAKIVKTCEESKPRIDPVDLMLFVWRSPRYLKGNDFRRAMRNRLAVLASGLPDAIEDYRRSKGGARHDYAGTGTDHG